VLAAGSEASKKVVLITPIVVAVVTVVTVVAVVAVVVVADVVLVIVFILFSFRITDTLVSSIVLLVSHPT
jgi:hypothetical protein